ncbi:MAG: hypothetical protein OXI60_05885 [Acidiferrobacterales bacterium]|nr:hypothetical protein [Acidiferrobacterales bacterium]
MIEFSELESNIKSVRDNPQTVPDPAEHLLRLGEQILENWLVSHKLEPTSAKHERYRLLALHRQGAINDPSFLACRDTCRELVYQVNLYRMKNEVSQTSMMAMVAMHLLYFVRGKLEVQQLGEFCCSSKPLRTRHSEVTDQ